MEPGRLSRDELIYELKVRGVRKLIGTSVTSMRNKLQDMVQGDEFGVFTVAEGVELDVTSEITVCHNKLITLGQEVARFMGPKSHPQYGQLMSCVAHVLGRLARIDAVSEEDKATCERLVKVAQDIEDSLENQVETRAALKSEAAEGDASIPDRSAVLRRQVPVIKWGLTFSGSRDGMSVSAFIERVEEIRGARNVSPEELFASGIDIFEGDALIWYRAVRAEITTWAELTRRLRAEFQPFDYEFELWNEIRARLQEEEESIGIYFACMANLFSRLPNPASEAEKLSVLRRNISPYFINGLGLTKVESVASLLESCKILECNRNMAEARLTKGVRTRLLEPDLGGPRSGQTPRKTTKESVQVSTVTTTGCWNCQQAGHRFSNCREPRKSLFCFRCGMPGVRMEQCPTCSGNEPRGQQKTGESPARV